ncbi:uncharacterized protein LOC127809999 [Diospyros lotus]|uniref:uncharacterized protein LOC127809999 n=1 Tax=Diospyros lotus TaxID=55363 RepID=UPI00224EA27B|nr:uncharacterized protein LOC127809999 [Diospyros lotus]
MEGIGATFSPFGKLPGRWFPTESSRRPLRKFAIRAEREMDGRWDYSGRLVDENMIVLRMRLREMKISELSHQLPESWTEWEKKHYAHYNEAVCEATGFLQSVLMNTRPSLALGLVVLIVLILPFSTFEVILRVLELAERVLFSGF